MLWRGGYWSHYATIHCPNSRLRHHSVFCDRATFHSQTQHVSRDVFRHAMLNEKVEVRQIKLALLPNGMYLSRRRLYSNKPYESCKLHLDTCQLPVASVRREQREWGVCSNTQSLENDTMVLWTQTFRPAPVCGGAAPRLCSPPPPLLQRCNRRARGRRRYPSGPGSTGDQEVPVSANSSWSRRPAVCPGTPVRPFPWRLRPPSSGSTASRRRMCWKQTQCQSRRKLYRL